MIVNVNKIMLEIHLKCVRLKETSAMIQKIAHAVQRFNVLQGINVKEENVRTFATMFYVDLEQLAMMVNVFALLVTREMHTIRRKVAPLSANVEQTLTVRAQKYVSKLAEDYVNASMVAVNHNVARTLSVSQMIIDQVVSAMMVTKAIH
jgi:hypothetical protein